MLLLIILVFCHGLFSSDNQLTIKIEKKEDMADLSSKDKLTLSGFTELCKQAEKSEQAFLEDQFNGSFFEPDLLKALSKRLHAEEEKKELNSGEYIKSAKRIYASLIETSNSSTMSLERSFAEELQKKKIADVFSEELIRLITHNQSGKTNLSAAITVVSLPKKKIPVKTQKEIKAEKAKEKEEEKKRLQECFQEYEKETKKEQREKKEMAELRKQNVIIQQNQQKKEREKKNKNKEEQKYQDLQEKRKPLLDKLNKYLQEVSSLLEKAQQNQAEDMQYNLDEIKKRIEQSIKFLDKSKSESEVSGIVQSCKDKFENRLEAYKKKLESFGQAKKSSQENKSVAHLEQKKVLYNSPQGEDSFRQKKEEELLCLENIGSWADDCLEDEQVISGQKKSDDQEDVDSKEELILGNFFQNSNYIEQNQKKIDLSGYFSGVKKWAKSYIAEQQSTRYVLLAAMWPEYFKK